MDLLYYDANGHDRQLSAAELSDIVVGESSLLWVNGEAQDLSGLTLPEPLASALRRTSRVVDNVRVYEQFYHFAIPVLPPSGEAIRAELSLLVGQDWLISIGPPDATDFAGLIERDVEDTMKGNLSGTTLAAALVAEHFARFHQHIAAIDAEIDKVEQRTLTGKEGRSTLSVLTVLRRRTARMRGVLSELRPIVNALIRPDFLPEMTRDDREHQRHLEGAFEKLSDEIVRLRETVVGSFELYATQIAQNTNRLLKALTVLTLGIGLIGAGAGIMGMNFKLDWFDHGARAFVPVVLTMAILFGLTVILALDAYRRD
jgi:Mg2+ and Co2+ transporter CorA